MRLPATATLQQASALAREVEQAVAAAPTHSAIEFDAGALESFDTSLVAVLLHARRSALAAGLGFSVVKAPEKLAQLARLYGVDGLLGLAGVAP